MTTTPNLHSTDGPPGENSRTHLSPNAVPETMSQATDATARAKTSLPASGPPPNAALAVTPVRPSSPEANGRHAHEWASSLDLPILPDVGAEARLRWLLGYVTANRNGAVAIGPKGAGKSLGLQLVLDEWNAVEQRKHQLDSAYTPRYVVPVGLLQGRTEREVLTDLLAAVLGAPPNLRVRGSRKTDQQLLEDLLTHLFEQNAVAFCVEEGEFVKDAGLKVLRDIMSEASRLDMRTTPAPATPSTSEEHPRMTSARGIGVLVVGTSKLEDKIRKSDEAGQRWVLIEKVGAVPCERVSSVYERWFPGFAPHIAQVSRKGWERYLHDRFTLGRSIPVRKLVEHVRLYARFIAKTMPTVTSREAIPFHAPLFETAWDSTAWGDV